jgi:hypothetical protein
LSRSEAFNFLQGSDLNAHFDIVSAQRDACRVQNKLLSQLFGVLAVALALQNESIDKEHQSKVLHLPGQLTPHILCQFFDSIAVHISTSTIPFHRTGTREE